MAADPRTIKHWNSSWLSAGDDYQRSASSYSPLSIPQNIPDGDPKRPDPYTSVPSVPGWGWDDRWDFYVKLAVAIGVSLFLLQLLRT